MEAKAGIYWWVRHIDETGMSGSGKVAQVAVFEDGSAVLRWLKSRNSAGVQSAVFYETVRDLEWVHGHGEKKTGSLVPAFTVGETVMIHSLEGFGGAAHVVEVSDSRKDSFYKVKFWDADTRGDNKQPFWAWNWEVHR